ncbi:helix-turn-helix domain-containing protein [Streptomyces melanosporofaciens]
MDSLNAEETLRTQTRAALKATGISQAAVARQLGLSQKHLSHMLTGRANLTLDWADRILALNGMRVVVCLEFASEEAGA